MKATIITIGDELLMGQVVDTNATFIAKRLDANGFEVVEIRTVSDGADAILSALQSQQNKVDLVVVTGGLGPTNDDVTKKTFCTYFDDHLIRDPRVYAHVKEKMESFYQRPLSDANAAQALVPRQAFVLFNEVGTAPGMLLVKEQTTYVSLPGVPFEMKHLIEKQLLPYLKKAFPPFYNVHQHIITQGIGESLLAEYLTDWENSLPQHVSLAYLPSAGRVKLRLSSHGADQEMLQKEMQSLIAALPQLIGDYIVGWEEHENIATALLQHLVAVGQTMSAAESCTGGRVAHLMTLIPGSSAIFKGSAVTYATASKEKILGVRSKTISDHGVVSEEVALEMARGAQRIYASDVALATTGNAGPSAGDPNVAIGTVCVGIVTQTVALSATLQLRGPREHVMELAANKALEMLYIELIKNK